MILKGYVEMLVPEESIPGIKKHRNTPVPVLITHNEVFDMPRRGLKPFQFTRILDRFPDRGHHVSQLGFKLAIKVGLSGLIDVEVYTEH
jgi:hypothetical protein